jgi:hypothetical protein
MDMLNLIFLLVLQIATPSELACVGSVQDLTIPMDLFVAGVEMEGTKTLATAGQLVYINGPKVGSLKAGMVQRVVRAEGRIRDPYTAADMGVYYRDIGTIRIEAVEQESATARVLSSCNGMFKGDQLIAHSVKQAIEFNGSLSNDVVSLPQNGLAGAILLGRNDLNSLAAGDFCYIGLGGRDGVKAGDRFTIFRYYDGFNPRDMSTLGKNTNASFTGVGNESELNARLFNRSLPPRILGDIVVVEAGDSVSTGKIINSLTDIHPGDLVIRR